MFGEVFPTFKYSKKIQKSVLKKNKKFPHFRYTKKNGYAKKNIIKNPTISDTQKNIKKIFYYIIYPTILGMQKKYKKNIKKIYMIDELFVFYDIYLYICSINIAYFFY